MGRKTREKGSNYIPVDYSSLLKELNGFKHTKKGYKRKNMDTHNRRCSHGEDSCNWWCQIYENDAK